MATPPHDNESGFTLVEVLVSLTVISIIVGLMLAIIGQYRLLGERREAIDRKNNVMAIASHLHSIIGGALRLPLSDAEEGSPRYLDGKTDRIRFVAGVRTGANRYGLREVVFELEEIDEGRRLVERHRLRRAISELEDIQAESNVIGDSISGIKFRYLPVKIGDDTSLHEDSWVTAWEDFNKLPYLIELTIEYTLNENHASIIKYIPVMVRAYSEI